jgi:hypothetical protein
VLLKVALPVRDGLPLDELVTVDVFVNKALIVSEGFDDERAVSEGKTVIVTDGEFVNTPVAELVNVYVTCDEIVAIAEADIVIEFRGLDVGVAVDVADCKLLNVMIGVIVEHADIDDVAEDVIEDDIDDDIKVDGESVTKDEIVGVE